MARLRSLECRGSTASGAASATELVYQPWRGGSPSEHELVIRSEKGQEFDGDGERDLTVAACSGGMTMETMDAAWRRRGSEVDVGEEEAGRGTEALLGSSWSSMRTTTAWRCFASSQHVRRGSMGADRRRAALLLRFRNFRGRWGTEEKIGGGKTTLAGPNWEASAPDL